MGCVSVWLIFIVTSVAFIPSLDASLSDCYEVTGLLVPVLTPLDEYGALDVDVVPQYAQYLRDKGVNGVIVAATIGEGPALNVSDNKRLLDAWMEAAPPLNLLVISSVGGVPFPDTLEMARYSEYLGVDAIFALPEVYYKPHNAEQLVYNMELIAREAPETPLVYDDIPEYTGVEVDIVEFFELAGERIKSFRGLKSNVFDNLLKLRTRTRGQQQLYSANITYLAPAVFLGFENYALAELNFFPKRIIDIINNGRNGNLTRTTNLYDRLIYLINLITEKGEKNHDFFEKISNFFPKRIIDIIKNGRDGNLNRTTNLYERLIYLINLITEKGNLVAAYKAAMPLLSGIDVGDVREPIYPLSDDDKQDLESRLRHDGNQRIINSQKGYDD